jgi:ParB/RepB/Spo0J family partition protein
MPKIEGASISRKISVSDITETGNVRENYHDIEELAASIKKNGLLEPILVKPAPAENGSPRFELIAGHRRVKAFYWLMDHGDDFSMIDAMIVTGDKLTIQLVENIQRSDLSARERERGIYLMTQNGLSQKEVAAELSKTEVFISRHVSAYKTRQIAEADGIDTTGLETSVFSEIQTVREEHIPMIVRYTLNDGGTVAAARRIMKDYRGNKPKPPEGEAQGEPGNPAEKWDPSVPPPDVDAAGEVPGNPAAAGSKDIAPELPPGEKPPRRPEAPAEPMERTPIKHKKVDVNIVFDEIYSYLSALAAKIKELGPDAEQSRIDEIKRQAALDIISLIHKRIDDA